MLGIPNLSPKTENKNDTLIDMLQSTGDWDGQPLINLLGDRELQPLIEAALNPSPETHASAVPADLRENYRRI